MKITFTTCADIAFKHGLIGLVRSIRKFYGNDDADIVVFVTDDYKNDVCFNELIDKNVDINYFSDIPGWVDNIIYNDDKYLNNSNHFYHPDFKIKPGCPDHHINRESGLKVHHLHPLNVKAYCTGYCLCVRKDDIVVHIDSDAFLLSRIDDIFLDKPTNCVIAFDDGTEDLPNLKCLYGIDKPANFDNRLYAINAGIVIYINGDNIQDLARDFMFYIDSCYHYTHSGTFADQGVLRALLACYHINDKINYELHDRTNWNPTWHSADNLDLINDEWYNTNNNKKQYIWHGAGGEKVWIGGATESVRRAWEWVGGEIRKRFKDYMEVNGSLSREHCQRVADVISTTMEKMGLNKIKILEIGTQYGRSSIAFASMLIDLGFDIKIDTVDIYAPSDDYQNNHSTIDEVKNNLNVFGLSDVIMPHKVSNHENLCDKFGINEYDVIYIDGDHGYRSVIADCYVANKLLKHNGLIIGDDYGRVKDAVHDFFNDKEIHNADDQWWIIKNA